MTNSPLSEDGEQLKNSLELGDVTSRPNSDSRSQAI